MKKAIVSGANGFVGSAVVKELIKNGVKVYALDLAGHTDNLPESGLVEFVPFDFRRSDELTNLLREGDYDVFYHFAWIGSAGEGRFDTQLQLNNAQWTVECMKAAKELGCKKFVVAGSIMEIETYTAAFAQGNKPGMGYVYGGGKLIAHTMCMSVAANLGIDLVWTQITNAYGAGERSVRFLNSTLRKIIKNEPLQFTSAVQNYDFIYIDDVARAFALIGEKGHPFKCYLIGSGNAKPLKQFILEIRNTLAPDREFCFGDVPFTGTNLELSVFNDSPLFSELGFRPEISFADGIKKTYDWLVKENDTKV